MTTKIASLNTKCLQPHVGWCKLNLDGVARDNLGIEMGRMLRFSSGVVVVGYTRGFGINNDSLVEAMSLICMSNLSYLLELETFSLKGSLN